MKNKKIIIYGAILSATIAALLLVYTMYASSMLSYLSSDPKACINCHVMHSAYTTWDNSSHKNVAKCIDCHLPVGDEVAKYTASVNFLTENWPTILKTFDPPVN